MAPSGKFGSSENKFKEPKKVPLSDFSSRCINSSSGALTEKIKPVVSEEDNFRDQFKSIVLNLSNFRDCGDFEAQTIESFSNQFFSKFRFQ